MKKMMTAGAALLMTTSIATAGGLDRSGQGIGLLFEDGNYAELSFGSIHPDVSGTGIGGDTGNVTPDYSQLAMGFKQQLTDQLSMALIYDQPFGADIDYDTGSTYVLGDTSAQVESDGLTALVRYEINPNFSVHGGLRYVQARGFYNRAALDPDGPGPAPVIPAYYSDYDESGGTGYVVGGAYERDDIAMRVALTYSSEIDLELDGSAGGNTLTTTLPESVNLDFQTGIAADTLLLASVRYVAWDGFSLDDSNPVSGGSIVSYDDDVYTYSVGVGRRFSDKFSASFTVGYEKPTGDPQSNLGPTDGFISYSLGGAYALDNGVEISGGVRYVDLGDADTTGVGGSFEDNDVIALGLKIGYSY